MKNYEELMKNDEKLMKNFEKYEKQMKNCEKLWKTCSVGSYCCLYQRKEPGQMPFWRKSTA